ncbi:hypothetical protein DFH07DRAFT_956300 [Mycena maculata]|uniref:DUF7029 domain-containing protein n=1 Tax=Mycena maculata TaxID=230809 RepID=A0AAD7JJD5_9AGAR|nr:hypothetical protein DFH07DRAFT_956300 [Mycena maculata]
MPRPTPQVMVLEDIESLVKTVVCQSSDVDESIVGIVFDSADAYTATLVTWSSLFQFMLVTLHPGCNPREQRGTWLVSSVSGDDFNSAILLQVQSIPLREMGSSFRVYHMPDSVSSGWRSQDAPRLQRRDGHVFPINKTFDFDPRQQLFPIYSSLIDGSITDIFPDPAGLQVFCVGCVSALDFTVGVELDVNIDLNVTAAWVNVTINDFQHDINLEISMNDSHTFSTFFDVLLVAIPDIGASFSDVATIGSELGGPMIYQNPRYACVIIADLEISGAINFTVTASASIPVGATATFNATNIDQLSASGWDGASFDVHPFRLNSGSFEVTAGISLSPFLEATIAFGNSSGSSVRLYLNTPHISGTASFETSVNRECQLLGPNNFESFADALTFGAGLNVSLEGNSSGKDFLDRDQIFLTKGFPFGDLPTMSDPLCMVVDDNAANTASESAGIRGLLPAATGTLLAASAAVPTFNIPGIESYYSAHGALPTNVNYTQMLLATAVPSDIQTAAAPFVLSALAIVSVSTHHSKVGAIVGGVIGGIAVVVIITLCLWHFYFHRRETAEEQDVAAWNAGLPKTCWHARRQHREVSLDLEEMTPAAPTEAAMEELSHPDTSQPSYFPTTSDPVPIGLAQKLRTLKEEFNQFRQNTEGSSTAISEITSVTHGYGGADALVHTNSGLRLTAGQRVVDELPPTYMED